MAETLEQNYLYLAVNSGDFRSTGTVNNFINQIQTVTLSGSSSDYEVALFGIDYNNVVNNYSGIFIYSDICGPSRIGSQMANVLMRIPRNINSSGTTAFFSPRILEWRPLQKTTINSISIQLKYYDGSLVPEPQNPAATYIVLCIRRKGTNFE